MPRTPRQCHPTPLSNLCRIVHGNPFDSGVFGSGQPAQFRRTGRTLVFRLSAKLADSCGRPTAGLRNTNFNASSGRRLTSLQPLSQYWQGLWPTKSNGRLLQALVVSQLPSAEMAESRNSLICAPRRPRGHSCSKPNQVSAGDHGYKIGDGDRDEGRSHSKDHEVE